MESPSHLGFWPLVRSIALVSLASQPILLTIVGLADAVWMGRTDRLLAVLATPMTLAFFGVPVLISSLFLVLAAYYALSFLGLRRLVPFMVFAIGAVIPVYQGLAKPPLSGAMPGYDQVAQLFLAGSLVTWAVYAYVRLDLRRA